MAQQVIHRTQRCLRTVTAATLATSFTLSVAASGSAGAPVGGARPSCYGKVATIVGTEGDDFIKGTARSDVIVGRGGKDRIDGGEGNDIICGGSGGGRYKTGDLVAQQELRGGPGNDVIIGGPDKDLILDRAGVDLLIGRGGSDYLAEYDKRVDPQSDVLRGGAGQDTLTSFRGADQLQGGAGNDVLSDRWGDNIHRGGSGNDLFETGVGDDALFGGSGTDTSLYVTVMEGRTQILANCSPVTADLSIGHASGSGFGVDTLEGVENIASGGGQDVLIGDDRSNTFYPGTLTACPGATRQQETVAGGAGSDRISFDSARWDPNQALGPVVVDLATGTAVQRSSDADVEVRLTLDSVENVDGTYFADSIAGDDGPNRIDGGPPQGDGDTIYGRDGDDYLFGSGTRDIIYGDAGADTLHGRAGNDRLDGGPGPNSINGGPGKDYCQNPDSFNGALDCEA
jgi:Ca2+-binding RTX toxin-like protein